LDTEQQRSLLALSFAPHGEGYVYYKDRWAPGIPVTTEEREQYLTDWSPVAARAFRPRIAGRAPATPPRGGSSAGQVQLQMLGAIPKSSAIGPGLSGLFAIFVLSRTTSGWLSAFALGAGVFLLLVGLAIAVFAGSSRAGARRP